MIIGGVIKTGNILHICCAVFFVLFFANANAQTKVYATTLVSSDHVTNVTNGYDGVLTTKADLTAKSNVTVIPGYDASIELQFGSTLLANTPSYVKITTEDNLLGSLVGGSLGSLISGVLGAVLTGNQEFLVEARLNTGAVVLSGNSTTASQFGTDKLRIVQNASGDYFIRIMPDQAYNRIKITNKVGTALLGLGATRTLSVFDAYYITGTAQCGDPVYTSFTASGTLSLASTGVTNPQNVLTPSTTDFSVINMGLLAAGSTIEQTVYYDGASNSTDTFTISLSASASLLTAGIASNITVIASNGSTVVQTKTLAELLTLNALTMTGGVVTAVNMVPGGAVDRITVKLSTAVSLAQSLNFYGVAKTLSVPVISAYTAICSGNTISLSGTGISGSQIKWYTVASGGTAVATTNSGVAFVTPTLTTTTTYYAEQFSGSCTGIRVAVPVTVVALPIAGSIAGDQSICVSKQPALLTSVSSDPGAGISYRWESSLDGVIWAAVPGQIASTYQPPVLSKSTFFRRITIVTASGINCESVPTASVKVTTKNCIVYGNPMVRQRVKNGA